MMEDLDRIDWNALGFPQMPIQVNGLTSSDRNTWGRSFTELQKSIAPWELQNGYGSHLDLLRLSQTDGIPLVVPFLIELLRNDETLGKAEILELLYDLAYYAGMTENKIPASQASQYQDWANRIKDAMRKDIDLYVGLAKSSNPELSQAATDLLWMLHR